MSPASPKRDAAVRFNVLAPLVRSKLDAFAPDIHDSFPDIGAFESEDDRSVTRLGIRRLHCSHNRLICAQEKRA